MIIRGARTHNLKNIDVEMPRGKMIAITGPSGSGKSSLAFDTIFAEGQRRYVESLSPYARQFLNKLQKPDVDEISGLSPAISIDQKSASRNPRSTVATVTEIYDYLRILYARVGQPYCLDVDVPIQKLSQDEILGIILKSIETKEVKEATRKQSEKVMGIEVSKGRVSIFSPVVVGRKGEYYQLLYDLLGKGYEAVKIDGQIKQLREKIELTKTKRHDIDVLIDEIYVSEFTDDPRGSHERLSEAVERALHESNGLVKIESPDGSVRTLSAKFICPIDGSSFPEVEPRLFSFNSPYGACPECNGLGVVGIFQSDECPACKGARLRPEAMRVYLGGDGKKDLGINIVAFTAMTVKEATSFIDNLKLSKKQQDIAWPALREIIERLQFMNNVGIQYLTLDRRANTLSGGEAQRIRLASQLGSGLVGALYVLDEPTIGLHQRDNDRLIKTLTELRDLGNTIIVVEHDEDTIRASDYLIDIGPGAGVHGGEVIVSDYLPKLLSSPKNESKSVTLDYLRGDKVIPIPARRESEKGSIKIRGGKAFNIKNLNVDIPLGRLICVTGVSGSGKSTFMYEIVDRNLKSRLEKKHRTPHTYNCKTFTGTEYLGRSILIDQSPIGRTPRSNPATYTGSFTHIRDMFAASGEARARGWKPGRFSFNVKGGRCEACQGNGEIAVEMHFLPTVYVTCDVCDGKRFTKETLEVTYRKKNIHEVLHMTIEEAYQFFMDVPSIQERLKSLLDVGLGYLELGQSATTLSGGEAQRVKIASELYKPHTQKTIYLLDEPTIGLHYEDVKKLIEILQQLVNQGNTVMVIEHNLDLIKSADYIIDIGPEGGQGGGDIVAKGTPEEVADTEKSFTGQYLKHVL
ncbi:excinuclease ABC subunit A [Candidatus Kaiserbacteria bacterium RIFCSPLOWO2_02_FULL_45_11b]|uniref:UvrABC system protein A n=1 Tax=Candidatus Kaiserbacteria bacterium RIFCSPLOWO2_12_FULL_45_26 TaxID=1798525 RepID=A0A1F6FHS0_9BACT|nr:MAG: excinuclease ABC subunit A [Candidatus Kaiserbacteria bacterium RIFCSPLOWO2_01_FULL_45_25]OGG81541.1 MAG: excinuclease ABC subunit A [Candidatus Kaiserbacteria bacterium RIFCSPLOWO2_02_FULL_45_11b]OGG85412.1 MAG: excinuclease ABC subunit A [Candidatus Kaiserbacteria bacterium RIFCSPLOWO2_12_FULL_45_26]